MAEINRDKESESGEFIFGQNMEERVVKVNDTSSNENCVPSTEKLNEEKQKPNQTSNLLRPSAFAASGVIAPSRLGANPFVNKVGSNASTENSDAKKDGGCKLNASRFTANPFSSMGHSNSDQEVSAGEHAEVDTSACKLKLRPSALDKQTAGFGKASTDQASPYRSSFKLEPAKLQNPLGNASDGASSGDAGLGDAASPTAAAVSTNQDTTKPELEAASSTTDQSEARSSNSPSKSAELPAEGHKSPDSTAKDTAKQSENLIPWKREETATHSVFTNSGFLFGQNLQDRVVSSSKGPISSEYASATKPSSEQFIFGQNLQERVSNTPVKVLADEKVASSTSSAEKSKTLEESAADYQAKQVRPELHEVEVITGEEDESNVFQINAKLFAFDMEKQNWLERGRGILRLNDMSDSNSSSFDSRLVMRTQGSLRVVLNTKIWGEMLLDRASSKSIRISAMDPEDGNIKVYLIMANPKDATQIHSAIDWRIQQVKAKPPNGQADDSEKKQVEKETNEATSSQDESSAAAPASSAPTAAKRSSDQQSAEEKNNTKRARYEAGSSREYTAEESNDSSCLDPETEASNESFSSAVKSSSSE